MSERRRNLWKGFCRVLPAILIGAAFLATMGSGLGIWSSHVERMSHFRLWWLGLLVFLAVFLALRNRRRLAVYAALIAIGAALPLLPYWINAGSVPASKNGNDLKVIAWNLLHNNPTDRHLAAEWLASQDADLIVLTECTFAWQKSLEPLHALYPHRISSGQDGAEGMLLLSRFPLDPPDPEGLAQAKPWISTVAHTPKHDLRVIGMHPRTPRSGSRFDQRNIQYDRAAEIARNSELPVILMGDLNCTPFSPWFRRLLERGKLFDSARGHGLASTWSGQGIGLPIDHILLSPHWQVVERRVPPDRRGSDHHPVVAKIRFHLLD